MKFQKRTSKKIVIFIPSIEYGGVEKNLYILIDYLRKIYSKVTVVTASKINKKINQKNVKVIRPKSNFWEKKSRFFKSLISSLLLINKFRKREILIISFQSNIFSIIISKFMFWPIIIRLNTSPEKYINSFFKSIFFKYFYNLSNEIIVNSFEFKKNLKRIFKLDSSVILNPFIKNKLKKKRLKFFQNFKGLKIINIGRLTDQKDHFTLLKSIKMITDKNDINIKLSIIVKGKNLVSIQNFIRKNNLKKKINLYGYKANAERYISHSDLFILSSKFEGLPNTLIEAQSSKVPIISSDCPSGPKEILLNGKLGILFKTGDHEDLYKKILLFNKNKKKYIKQAFLAQSYLKRFDYKSNLSKYPKIINKYI